MEKLDQNLQQRVWGRVYGQQPVLNQQTRQKLQQCRRRELENAKIYESLSHHSRYGDAFRHMARQANEHAAMIDQILGGDRR